MTRFRVLCSDPPWRFFDSLPGDRGAEDNYQTLPLEDICSFPLPPMEDDALLLLWRVASMVEEAYCVIRDWGFVPKSEIVWRKLTSNGKPWFGLGRYVRASHETCVVATRGRFKVSSRSIRSVFSARVPTDGKGRYVHSAKPEQFYDLVEDLTRGPYVELFGRRQRQGWLVLGNQPDLRERVRALTLFGHDGNPNVVQPERGERDGQGDRPEAFEDPHRGGQGAGQDDP